MKIGTSYKQHGIEGTYDVIVIGSGIGGLASAALLAKHARKRVLVLERHYTAGGFTHTFHRPGYEWDVGVHYIGQTQPKALLRRAFDEITNGALEWADMGEVYDTILIGEDRYEFRAGRENWRRRMHAYFPKETRAIDRYLELVERCVKSSQLFFAEKALPTALAAILGPAMRYPMMRLGAKSTLEVIRELTDDSRLLAVLTGQWGDYGLTPADSSFFIHALVTNHYFEGGAYPVGGASRIAQAVLPLIEAAGGKVMTLAEVDEVLVEKNTAVGVRLADGAVHRASTVISDAGVANTLGRLLPSDVASRHGLDRSLNRVEPSLAHASLYLGFKKTAEQLGLGKSNLWVYPDEDHDSNVARFLADKDAPLPVAYLSFPSAKDPDFENRHPGRATVEVVALAPYDWFQKWEDTRWKKRGAEYENLKSTLTHKMLRALYGQCPALEAELDHCELSSPLSTRHFANFANGEIYGLAHTPQRFAERWLRPKTPIRGLYLTGADICSAGVGGALFGGVLTVSSLLGKNMVKTIARRPRTAPRPAASKPREAHAA